MAAEIQKIQQFSKALYIRSLILMGSKIYSKGFRDKHFRFQQKFYMVAKIQRVSEALHLRCASFSISTKFKMVAEIWETFFTHYTKGLTFTKSP